MNAVARIEPQVRTALPSDEEEVMDMCRMLYSENALFEWSEFRVLEQMRRALLRQGGILGVIGDTGHIQAMIYMMFAQIWYSDGWHLEELFSYVRPEYRKSDNAKVLIRFAKRCSDELGLPLSIGVISNDRTEQKVELYRRQFKKPSGAFFTYNTKWQSPLAMANTSATAC